MLPQWVELFLNTELERFNFPAGTRKILLPFMLTLTWKSSQGILIPCQHPETVSPCEQDPSWRTGSEGFLFSCLLPENVIASWANPVLKDEANGILLPCLNLNGPYSEGQSYGEFYFQEPLAIITANWADSTPKNIRHDSASLPEPLQVSEPHPEIKYTGHMLSWYHLETIDL